MNKITYIDFHELITLCRKSHDEIVNMIKTLNVNVLDMPAISALLDVSTKALDAICGKEENDTLSWYFDGGYEDITIQELYNVVINKNIAINKNTEKYQNFDYYPFYWYSLRYDPNLKVNMI